MDTIIWGVKVTTFKERARDEYVQFELYRSISLAWDAAYDAMEEIYGNDPLFDVAPADDDRTINVFFANGRKAAMAEVIRFALIG